jgi:2,3-bisphosphoglycerate-independent phosphoglycerate mutase
VVVALKYVVLLGDGMADRPVPELGGKTPLMEAKTPNMDFISRGGVLGMVRTIPEGMPLGSDVANLSVLGYDPAQVYTGRSPIEAAGIGVQLGPADIAYRCNLVTLARVRNGGLEMDLAGSFAEDLVMVDFAGGHPTEDEASAIIRSLSEHLGRNGIEFHRSVSYRHLMVWRGGIDNLEVMPPHDLADRRLGEGWPRGGAAAMVISLEEESVRVLADHPVNRRRAEEGKKPVNSIWLWGQGKKPSLAAFHDQFGLSGAMITAVDLMKGLGVSVGFEILNVPGATGYLDTNYEGKASAVLDALNRVDLAYLHVEAPDEASHGGSLEDKIRALEDFDSRAVGPILEGLKKTGPFRVLLLPDHSTPLEVKTHTGDEVPFAVYDSDRPQGCGKEYNEGNAAASGIRIDRGNELMGRFVRGEI